MSQHWASTGLSEELVLQAQEELNENLETRSHDIEVFRKAVLDEKDLTTPTDDAFLLRFLRARKFDQMRSLKLLKGYYKFKLKHVNTFTEFNPQAVQHVLTDGCQLNVLPDRDQLNRRVVIIRIGHWNPNNCSFDDIVKALNVCLELIILDEPVQVTGLSIIVDGEDIGFTQVRNISLTALQRLISLAQGTFPFRMKGFHLVRQPFEFNIIFALLKPFMTEKLKKRVIFHGKDLKSLHKYIAPDILPKEFGGPKPPMDNSEFLQYFLSCSDYFTELNKYGYNKSSENGVV